MGGQTSVLVLWVWSALLDGSSRGTGSVWRGRRPGTAHGIGEVDGSALCVALFQASQFTASVSTLSRPLLQSADKETEAQGGWGVAGMARAGSVLYGHCPGGHLQTLRGVFWMTPALSIFCSL